jgi:hypothetical protein
MLMRRRAGFTVNLHELANEASQFTDVLKGIRRELHQIPEFALHLPKP